MALALPEPLAALVADRHAVASEAGESGCAVWRLERAGERALYLKHGRGRFASDVVDEAARLHWLSGRIPVPAVRQFVFDGDAAWLLTEAMPGRTADQICESDHGSSDEIARLCGGFLRRLHALPIDDCPFDASHPIRLAAARRNVDAGLVDEDDFDEDYAGRSAGQVWDEIVAMLPIDVDRVVTHGDYSMGNVLIAHDAVVGCIDVGRAGVADRYQDLAIFWQNLAQFGNDAQHSFLKGYGIDRLDPKRLLFHRALDELF